MAELLAGDAAVLVLVNVLGRRWNTRRTWQGQLGTFRYVRPSWFTHTCRGGDVRGGQPRERMTRTLRAKKGCVLRFLGGWRSEGTACVDTVRPRAHGKGKKGAGGCGCGVGGLIAGCGRPGSCPRPAVHGTHGARGRGSWAHSDMCVLLFIHVLRCMESTGRTTGAVGPAPIPSC